MERFGKLRGLLVYQKLMTADRGVIQVSIPELRSPVSIRAGTSDVSTFEEVFLDREYSIPIEVDPKLIIDGGANIGLTSLYFANTYPDARIIAVEPEETNIELLRKNIAGYANIDVIAAGIWPSHGALKIENPTGSKCAFRLIPGEATEHSIPAITIEDILTSTRSDAIDILKLDIEGAEKEVLKDSHGWNTKVHILAVELHDRFKPGCREALYSSFSRNAFIVHEQGHTTLLVKKNPGLEMAEEKSSPTSNHPPNDYEPLLLDRNPNQKPESPDRLRHQKRIEPIATGL